MNQQASSTTPNVSQLRFMDGIRHPELWLWDSWTLDDAEGLHLYCLALNKHSAEGEPITPPERNNYRFHVRHFLSTDEGKSWTDCGAVLEPGHTADGADARNVWSGSVFRRADGEYLFGYTGVRQQDGNRDFLQTICMGTASSANGPVTVLSKALSCPLKDYEAITSLGYYLGPKERLGDNNGEEQGPILAWRDPYFFIDEHETLNAMWASKVAPTSPAIARATLKKESGEYRIDELLPPVMLPDSEEFTQAEVPKIYRDAQSGDFYLLISACNRVYEGQPDSEVNQELRLYRSQSSNGPWQCCSAKGSLLPDLNYLFGASIINPNFAEREITLLGPYTENAGKKKQLTFEAPLTLRF